VLTAQVVSTNQALVLLHVPLAQVESINHALVKRLVVPYQQDITLALVQADQLHAQQERTVLVQPALAHLAQVVSGNQTLVHPAADLAQQDMLLDLAVLASLACVVQPTPIPLETLQLAASAQAVGWQTLLVLDVDAALDNSGTAGTNVASAAQLDNTNLLQCTCQRLVLDVQVVRLPTAVLPVVDVHVEHTSAEVCAVHADQTRTRTLTLTNTLVASLALQARYPTAELLLVLVLAASTSMLLALCVFLVNLVSSRARTITCPHHALAAHPVSSNHSVVRLAAQVVELVSTPQVVLDLVLRAQLAGTNPRADNLAVLVAQVVE